MHSIRNRLLLIICFSVVGLYILMSFTAVYSVNKMVEENADTALYLLAKEKSNELNNYLSGVERGVDTAELYIRENFDKARFINDKEYQKTFTDELAKRCNEIGKVIGNVETIYFRPVIETYGNDTGFFMTAGSKGDFIRVELTDITRYAKTDREHVAWYYEPLESGEPIWLDPYYNKNINVYMISYVIPIYIDGEIMGIIGMDINMAAIHEIVDSIIYKNGYGFLLDDRGDIIYHKDYPGGLTVDRFNNEMRTNVKYLSKEAASKNEIHKGVWNGEEVRLSSANLNNNMILGILIGEKDLMRERTSMIIQMLVIFVIVFIIVVIVFVRVMVLIVNPIRTLTKASTMIARGELNTNVEYESKDEIGALAKSINMMATEIREYFRYMHSQAYTDAMTGVGNKAAYMDEINMLERKIEEGMAEFFVVVFDVNGLKRVNDNLGHEYGDMLIIDSANIIKHVFSAENVYRIGGDEFIVVMENAGEEDISGYIEKFDGEVRTFNKENVRYEHDLAISKGAVAYSESSDSEYKDVFKRADELMYRDKEAFYRGRNDRRKR
ncbi:MAG: diguanylate cyclase [Lachnospiraceae bacterium]|nr:diguanylate cyclase [Lachnospiraceae bacterium]